MKDITKAQAAEKLQLLFKELKADYQKEGSLPTDRKITQLAHAFHERDRDRQIGLYADTESMAVTRGIVVGMMAMRQIIEG